MKLLLLSVFFISNALFSRCDQTVDVGGPDGYSFVPKELTIKVNETVNFKWSGTLPHDVVSSTGPNSCTPDTKWNINSGLKTGAGQSFSKKFTTAGDVYYFCTPHCAMNMFGHIKVA